MAEFVQQNIEEMLPELEQMERVGLFTAAETKKMLKKRRAFEYKLRRRTRQKDDYLLYIRYEINVLDLVKKRREKTGYTFKRLEIDIAIVMRIHKLFKHACFRFPNDLNLWTFYIQFCQKRKEKASVTKIYTRMLQLHSRKPELWIMAAQYQLEVVLALDDSRSLMQRGINFNPESQLLRHEYYRLELINTDRIRKRREILGIANMEVDAEEASQAVLDGSVALAVYTISLDDFADKIDFILGFLSICRQFDFTKNHEEKMLGDLKFRFPEHELTWDALARTHLQTPTGKVKSSHRSRCYEVFDEAVKTVPTERMWDLYMKCCIEQMHGKHMDKKVEVVLSVCERASSKNLLSAPMYLKWVEILTNAGLMDRISAVLTKATQCHKQDCTVWVSRLAWEQQSGGTNVEAVFEEAAQNVPAQESLPLWQGQLAWACLHHPLSTTSAFFDRAITFGGPQVAPVFKAEYLRWTAAHKDNKAVRKLYDRLVTAKPLPLEFFETFIEIQKAQAPTKIKAIRAAHEAAVGEYGATEPDVWLSYIKMEMTHDKGAASSISQLHWRALKTLNPVMAEVFKQRWTLTQNGNLTEEL